MNEFDLIDRIVSELGPATHGKSVLVGPGDDCAQIDIPPGHELVSSIDTFVQGRHFPEHAGGDLVGYRAMVVNLSDLAAMGALPSHALLAMTLPDIDAAWVDAFCRGVRKACLQFSCPLVGGNITRGPLNISVSVHGLVEKSSSLKRSTAATADLLCLTGDIGGAALALSHPRFMEDWTLDALINIAPGENELAIQKYYLPQPRLAYARQLVGVASAAIDVSDGLLADAAHLAKASGVGMRIQLENIPCFTGVPAEKAVVAGDDYELCFTLPKANLSRAQSLAQQHNLPVHVIGHVETGSGVQLYHKQKPLEVDFTGYQHFNNE
jgi:thiamine-monophosphate kinase